jgi:hypothetical protein
MSCTPAAAEARGAADPLDAVRRDAGAESSQADAKQAATTSPYTRATMG